jgi:hypothetical protein
MENKNKILLLIGGLLIVLSTLSFSPQPEGVEALVDIDIPKPSDIYLDRLSPISDIVTEQQDRVNLCIFNKLFGDRVVNYKTSQQELNDLYVLSAKNFFGDSIKNKYEDLDKFLVDAIIKITGDDIHQLTDEEKLELQKTFYGISWALNN